LFNKLTAMPILGWNTLVRSAPYWILGFALLTKGSNAAVSSVSCSSDMDSTYTIVSCINEDSEWIQVNGTCSGGIQSEVYQFGGCPYSADTDEQLLCHDCGSNRIVCASTTDAMEACSSGATPTDQDCMSLDDDSLLASNKRPYNLVEAAYQCASSTESESTIQTCTEQKTLLTDLTTEFCSTISGNSDISTCLVCGAVQYCVAQGTTCNDLGIVEEPIRPDPMVSCGSIDKTYAVTRCLDDKIIATIYAECIGGSKGDEYIYLEDCSDWDSASPFCHECGLHNTVCSDSQDSAAACSSFQGGIPTDFTCTDGVGYLIGNQCNAAETNNADWQQCYCDEERIPRCEFDDYSNTCASDFPEKPLCLYCGRAIHCAPEGTTCADLQLAPVPNITDATFFPTTSEPTKVPTTIPTSVPTENSTSAPTLTSNSTLFPTPTKTLEPTVPDGQMANTSSPSEAPTMEATNDQMTNTSAPSQQELVNVVMRLENTYGRLDDETSVIFQSATSAHIEAQIELMELEGVKVVDVECGIYGQMVVIPINRKLRPQQQQQQRDLQPSQQPLRIGFNALITFESPQGQQNEPKEWIGAAFNSDTKRQAFISRLRSANDNFDILTAILVLVEGQKPPEEIVPPLSISPTEAPTTPATNDQVTNTSSPTEAPTVQATSGSGVVNVLNLAVLLVGVLLPAWY